MLLSQLGATFVHCVSLCVVLEAQLRKVAIENERLSKRDDAFTSDARRGVPLCAGQVQAAERAVHF